jgi:cytochrome c556
MELNRMTRNNTLRALVALAVISVAGSAFAEDAASIVKARKDYYHVLGKAAKGSGEEFKKMPPSITEIQKYAAILDAEAPKLLSHFPAGSGPESGVKTDAKAEIWTKPDAFKKAAGDLAAAAHTYNLAAQKGDLLAAGAAMKAVGGTCKSCHEQFKAKDEH